MEQTLLHAYFRKKLLDWYDPDQRPMPWKSEKNPYRIWLSEIILQQTRVQQGLPYYRRFVNHFPTVFDLANAPEDEVLKNWEGLGYYSRARNLHTAAKHIVNEFGGVFPKDYADIISLKGVGPYTAAAIASFVYDLPYAVVDGNVYRVLSRFFGIEEAIDSTSGKKRFSVLAQTLLDKKAPGDYNQAIIDFGAIQCKPKSPNCQICPLAEECFARQNQMVNSLPVKAKKITKTTRYFNYLILNNNHKCVIRKRDKKDIWKGLYEFPYFESRELLSAPELLKQEDLKVFAGNKFTVKKISKPFQQILSHQKIIAQFIELEVLTPTPPGSDVLIYIQKDKLRDFAFPKIIDLYLRDNSLYLELL